MTQGTPLSAAQEYYALNIRIDNRRTVGVGACPGCQTAMGFVANSIVLAYGPNGALSQTIEFPKDDILACWQCLCGIYTDIGFLFGQCVTAVRDVSWGAIKSLYR
jgi:hypothetical protein